MPIYNKAELDRLKRAENLTAAAAAMNVVTLSHTACTADEFTALADRIVTSVDASANLRQTTADEEERRSRVVSAASVRGAAITGERPGWIGHGVRTMIYLAVRTDVLAQEAANRLIVQSVPDGNKITANANPYSDRVMYSNGGSVAPDSHQAGTEDVTPRVRAEWSGGFSEADILTCARIVKTLADNQISNNDRLAARRILRVLW